MDHLLRKVCMLVMGLGFIFTEHGDVLTVVVEHYTLYTVRACSSLLHASVRGHTWYYTMHPHVSDTIIYRGSSETVPVHVSDT